MTTRLLLIALLYGISSVSRASSEEQLVRQYLQVVRGKTIPSLADYYLFEGEASELEAQFIISVCRRRGWSPAPDNPECARLIGRREADRTRTPSLYFAWLRKRLPVVKKVEIVDVKRIQASADDLFAHDQIRVRLNELTDLEFFKPIRQPNAPNFGKLGLAKIEGTNVSELVQKELRSIDSLRPPGGQ